MAVWKELGRFLERGSPLLDEGVTALQEARASLVALRPTIDALPQLVRELTLLAAQARRALEERAR